MGIFEKGFEKPSPVQERAIPIILQNRNVLARAKNGTGKTACFVLGMLRLVSSEQKPQALCLCPTRELAKQSASVCSQIGRFLDAKVLFVFFQET